MSMNKVILHGNLTRDPELRYLQNGTPVAGFGVAVNRRWKSEDGQEREEVTFIDVEVWSKRAEVVAQYFNKGSQILLEGRLKLDQWEKDGQKHSKFKVVLENFSFVGSKESGGSNGHSRGEGRQDGDGRRQRGAEAPQDDAREEEEVPF